MQRLLITVLALQTGNQIFKLKKLSIMNLSSRTSFLVFLAHFNPELWEIIHPHEPLLTEGSRHVMASMVIKSIAKEVTDSNVAKELNSVGKSVFDSGVKSLSYDEYFEPWGPHPRPNYLEDLIKFGPSPEPWYWVFTREEVMLNPQPLPPHEQSYYGGLLFMLADAVSAENTAEVLRKIGTSLMKQSISANDKYSKAVPSF